MKSRRLRWLLVVGLLLAVPVVLLAWAHLQGKWALARYKSKLIAQGEKLTVAACQPAPAPTGENRFREFMLAAGRVNGLGVSSLAPPLGRQVEPGRVVRLSDLEQWPSSRGRSNVTWAMLADSLAASSNHLSEATALLHEPVLDSALDYRQGFNALLPHLAPCRGLGQHLSSATAHALREKQHATALEHIKDLLATIHLLERERVLISQLVRCALSLLAVDTTWQALQTPGWTDGQLASLQQAWQTVAFLPELTQALEMERAMMVETYAALRSSATALNQFAGVGQAGGGAGGGATTGSFDDLLDYLAAQGGELVSRNILLPMWQFSLSHADERHYLETVQILIEAARACARERSGDPVRPAKALLEQRDDGRGVSKLRYFLSRNLAGALDRGIDRALNAETQKELVLAAIAIQRYTRRHGRPPPALEDLVPEWLPAVPRDYWAGRPLGYRANSDRGPLLYSVGQDRRDAGGDPNSEGNRRNPSMLNACDMVWPAPAVPAVDAR